MNRIQDVELMLVLYDPTLDKSRIARSSYIIKLVMLLLVDHC